MAHVILGALASFAVFAATTITNFNAPGTEVIGDMGIFPGTVFAGFPPGNVSGSMYGGGSFAGNAKAAAQIAYNNATGQTSTTTMTNPDLVGLTLLPGVYKFPATAALSAGNFYLNASGDVDAVWIFQVGSTLDVSVGGIMNFTDGLGNANNVVWAVGTSATLLSNSHTIGNVLANTAVSCQSKASVFGRLVSLGASVTLVDNSISFPANMAPTGQPSSAPTSTLSPELGTFASFAVFASATITSYAAPGTIVTGDMGTFPGTAFTGFPPGICTGTQYSAGPFAGIVKGDAQIAYLAAAAQASTMTLSNVDLMGLTLSPGVYKFGAAAALSGGQLFLDAHGNPNALWTFQIGSSLNIAAKTEMLFVGGVGNPDNVLWQIGSSATLNPLSSSLGNFLALASITMMNKASLNGRLLALNGAVTLVNNIISVPMKPVKTGQPSAQPTDQPTGQPSSEPSISHVPTVSPTLKGKDKDKDKHSSGGGSVSDGKVGMIVGVVVAGVVLVAVVAAAVVYKGKEGAALAQVPTDEDNKL